MPETTEVSGGEIQNTTCQLRKRDRVKERWHFDSPPPMGGIASQDPDNGKIISTGQNVISLTRELLGF